MPIWLSTMHIGPLTVLQSRAHGRCKTISYRFGYPDHSTGFVFESSTGVFDEGGGRWPALSLDEPAAIRVD